jgi:hypothetical protein
MLYQIGDNSHGILFSLDKLYFGTLGRLAIMLPSLFFIHLKLVESYKIDFRPCDCTPLGFTLIV